MWNGRPGDEDRPHLAFPRWHERAGLGKGLWIPAAARMAGDNQKTLPVSRRAWQCGESGSAFPHMAFPRCRKCTWLWKGTWIPTAVRMTGGRGGLIRGDKYRFGREIRPSHYNAFALARSPVAGNARPSPWRRNWPGFLAIASRTGLRRAHSGERRGCPRMTKPVGPGSPRPGLRGKWEADPWSGRWHGERRWPPPPSGGQWTLRLRPARQTGVRGWPPPR